MAHFFIVAEEERGCERRALTAGRERLQDGQHDRYAGLVVQVTAFDVARFSEFHARVQKYEIAHLDAQSPRLRCAGGASIQADLHAVLDALAIARLVTGMHARADRLDRTACRSALSDRVHAHVLILDSIPGIAAELGEQEPAVGLDLAHHGAQGVDVTRQGPLSQ